MDIIASQGKKHRCIYIQYNDAIRLIEPYSFRRFGNNIILYAYERVRNGERTSKLKSYSIEKIDAVTPSYLPFNPRWPVEF